MDKKRRIKENILARWLDGRLNEQEASELNKDTALNELQVVIDEIDTWKTPEFDVEAGLEQLNKQKSTVKHLKKPKRFPRIAIAASIIVFLSSYLFWNYFSNQNTIIQTTIAEHKTINLPKGSVVKLDAVSSLSYKTKNWESNRTLSLEGQAFFDVTKGTTFKVTTPHGTVTVLGTQFNVKVVDSIFVVQCYEGSVKVKSSKQEEILIKGQTVNLQQGKLLRYVHTDLKPEWLLGYSKYDHALLSGVVLDLQKYYKVDVQLPKQYKNLEFTGLITHKNLKEALYVLFTSMELEYEVTDNNLIIVK